MTTVDDHLNRWWGARSEEQRSALKVAAESDAPAAALLIATGCPIGPVGTAWQGDDYRWTWPESVREFVASQ
ncbi:MAG: hypothetical protein QOK18_4123 [Mycobacterium sp.]|jgi:hypothetical protein|nr:hypothetical protein [Mycobacterium sp.]